MSLEVDIVTFLSSLFPRPPLSCWILGLEQTEGQPPKTFIHLEIRGTSHYDLAIVARSKDDYPILSTDHLDRHEFSSWGTLHKWLTEQISDRGLLVYLDQLLVGSA